MKLALLAVTFVMILATLMRPLGADEPHWRFVSMPDFLNVDTDYPQRSWEEALQVILSSVKAEDPDFLVVPGDIVMGHWHGEKDRPGVAGIEHFAQRYYPAWKARLQAYELPFYVTLGDHEIGDNPWRGNKADLVPDYKRVFREHIGMPLNGPKHMQGTAFWWRHNNALFVSVDVFEEGESNQGGICAGVTGKQLEWLTRVLEEHADIQHMFVMGHTPILGPVRQWSSSGLMLTGGRDSSLWQVLKSHQVDLYLCGEVHAVTCTERDGVQQIAHGGLIGYNTRTNYLVVDVYPNRLELTLKEIDLIPSGEKLWQPGTNRPLENVTIAPTMKQRGFVPVGHLVIDTTSNPKQFRGAMGYFLKQFEISGERATPVFSAQPKPLPRINLDGSVTER